MNEEKLKIIIRDLWCCVSRDKLRSYLWEHGKEPKEIDEYINGVLDIVFKRA